MKNFKTKIGILALASGILSFIHLFGIEKALFAVIFGSILLNENKINAEKPSKKAIAAIVLGFIYIVIIIIVTVIKGPEFFNFMKNLK